MDSSLDEMLSVMVMEKSGVTGYVLEAELTGPDTGSTEAGKGKGERNQESWLLSFSAEQQDGMFRAFTAMRKTVEQVWGNNQYQYWTYVLYKMPLKNPAVDS